MAPGPSTDCLKACGHVADIEDVDSFRNRRAPTIALCVLGLLVLGQMLRTQVTLQSGPFTRIVDDYLYNATQFAFSLAVVWRAWSVSRERTAWGVIGISLLTWSSGNVVWNLLVSDGHTGASVADAFWLVAYPGLYAGLWLLFRGRVAGVTRASVLDGLVVGLAVAAIASATLFDALWTAVGTAGTSSVSLAVNVAYPVGDLVLLSLVGAGMVTCGRRPSASWTLLAAGLATFALADITFLWKSANALNVETSITSTFWLIGLGLVAFGAWRPPVRTASAKGGMTGLFALLGGAMLALGLLGYGARYHVGVPATMLATATLGVVLVRLVFTQRENLALLDAARRDSTTDHLTGLANRRQLLRDLDRAVADGDFHRTALVIFDLNGFKGYNDALGHLAGDALLARLGDRLGLAVEAGGTAYRMGGDEFCVLVSVTLDETADAVAARYAHALQETHADYAIGCSAGAALIPDDANDAETALLVADTRMYAEKSLRRAVLIPEVMASVQ